MEQISFDDLEREEAYYHIYQPDTYGGFSDVA